MKKLLRYLMVFSFFAISCKKELPAPVDLPVVKVSFIEANSTGSQYIATGKNGIVAGSKATLSFVSDAPITLNDFQFKVIGNGTVTAIKTMAVTAAAVGDFVLLTGINIPVPTKKEIDLDFYVNYPGVGLQGLLSGVSSQIQLVYLKYTINGKVVIINNLDVKSSVMTLVGSKPVVAITKPNAQVIVGMVQVGELILGADLNGDVAFNTISPKIIATNATLGSASGIVFRDGLNNIVPTTSTALDSSDVSTITFSQRGYTVSAGQVITLRLFVPVTAVNATGANSASITTSFPSSGLSWTDIAGNGPVAAYNGEKIWDYPNLFTSIIYN